MPTFTKRKTGWKAEVARKGIRRSQTFPTKAAAIAWAGRIEAEIIGGERGDIPNLPFADILTRYARDVSPTKKGARWETIRIDLLKRDPLALVRLRSLSSTDVAAWRDRRLQAVSASSVRREWNLLSHTCNIAVNEWRWLKSNPFKGVRRPQEAQHRTRLATDAEMARLAEVATTPARRRVLDAFLFAVETGMRAGEICALNQVSGRVATLPDTKNGTQRQVPLSNKALALLGDGFAVKPSSIDALWRDMCRLAGISNLHFHDSRRMAITRLSKIFNPLQLAKIVGHKDLKMLLVYYNESAEELAKKL